MNSHKQPVIWLNMARPLGTIVARANEEENCARDYTKHLGNCFNLDGKGDTARPPIAP